MGLGLPFRLLHIVSPSSIYQQSRRVNPEVTLKASAAAVSSLSHAAKNTTTAAAASAAAVSSFSHVAKKHPTTTTSTVDLLVSMNNPRLHVSRPRLPRQTYTPYEVSYCFVEVYYTRDEILLAKVCRKSIPEVRTKIRYI